MFIQASGKVFRNWRYAALAIGISAGAFAVAVLLPNIGLLARVFFYTTASLMKKITFASNLLGSIRTNFTMFSGIYTIAIAVLFGIYMSFITYVLRHRIERNIGQGEIAAGVAGVASGAFGIGCAACGSVLLSGVLPLLGISAGVFSRLPFGGNEFGVLGVILLTLSIHRISQTIMAPGVCRR